MKKIVKRRTKIDVKKLKLGVANDNDVKELIRESCMIYEDGKPTVAYLELADDLSETLAVLKRIRYEKSARTGGLPTISRIFGYSPRVTLRKDFCSSTSLAHEDRHANETICFAGKLASDYYRNVNPALFKKHNGLTDKVPAEWVIRGTPFTSGIINRNNQLRYHLDTGNFKDVWSAMYVFKSDVEGGHLNVPEYDVAFELKNKSLLLFDGQSLLHGVTPIKYKSPHAYRFSIVYYSLAGMWKCLPFENEIKRIRSVKTERERKRAAR